MQLVLLCAYNYLLKFALKEIHNARIVQPAVRSIFSFRVSGKTLLFLQGQTTTFEILENSTSKFPENVLKFSTIGARYSYFYVPILEVTADHMKIMRTSAKRGRALLSSMENKYFYGSPVLRLLPVVHIPTVFCIHLVA